MNTHFYGGNLVKLCTLGNPGKQVLGSGPYEYYIYETRSDESIIFDDLRSFTVYLFEKSKGAVVHLLDVGEQMMLGDSVQAEDVPVSLKVVGGVVKFLVAGTKEACSKQKGLFFSSYQSLYRVEKPWGYELWINGQHPSYALKEIYLKAGAKTSLQYHNFKQETNVLFRGQTKLHYKINNEVNNDNVSLLDLGSVELGSISSIDVMPGVLHRLEAVTDILLYETSTAHLDDVVRVQDDSNRPHGRVEQEHFGK
jgi:mannose-6-phosphate isomerase